MKKNKITVHSVLIISAVFSLALFTGCSTPTAAIASYPDSEVSYANYKSFQMLKPSVLEPFGNSAATPTLVRQVRKETEAAFIAKGLVKSPDSYADMFILIHGGVAEKLDVQDGAFTYGRYGRGFAGRQELNQYKEGSLFIDVLDAKTRELIWRGSVMAEVGESPEPEKVTAAVKAIVSRYPN